MILSIKRYINWLISIFKKEKEITIGFYGEPNVGKTSLANRISIDFTGEPVGSVSIIPHETRTVLKKEKVQININNFKLIMNLLDMPGMSVKVDYRDFLDYGMSYEQAQVRAKEATKGIIEAIKFLDKVDAAEEGRILPDIVVEVSEINKDEGRYLVHIEDNGTGIPEKLIGKALGMMLAGTKFHRYVQQRGQQGIGAAGVTMYSQLTTGKSVKVISGYKGKKVTCEVLIDIRTNKPKVNILNREPSEWHGLIYEAEVKDVKYDKSSYGVYEYLKRTALANPHASITFLDPLGERHIFPRSVDVIPPKPKPVKPHPLGISTSDLIDFAHYSKEPTLSSFFRNTFSRISQLKLDELRNYLPDINFRMKPRMLSWEQADRIVSVFKKIKWISPSSDGIYPIGEKQIKKSIYNILNPEFCD